jgi:hypothetical protein
MSRNCILSVTELGYYYICHFYKIYRICSYAEAAFIKTIAVLYIPVKSMVATPPPSGAPNYQCKNALNISFGNPEGLQFHNHKDSLLCRDEIFSSLLMLTKLVTLSLYLHTPIYREKIGSCPLPYHEAPY